MKNPAAPPLAVLCLSALLLCSCAGETLLPVRQDPRVAELKNSVTEKIPYTVAVPPLSFELGATPLEGLDGRACARDMADILFETGLFSSVTAVADEADLLLRLRATSLTLRFRGRNKWYLPNLLLWAALVFPAWFVADETYGASLDLEATVFSARSGRMLAAHSSAVYVERELDDFERGWFPLGILLAPTAFSSGNWRKVGERLLPPALRAALLDQAKWLASGFHDRVKSGEIGRLGSVSFAVCAGGSKYESDGLKDLAAPRDRALKLGSILADPRIGGMAPDRVSVLADSELTAGNLAAELESALVRRTRLEDSALVFLSGYFQLPLLKGEAVRFMTYDSVPAKDAAQVPTRALGLDTLADMVKRSNAERVLLVFDPLPGASAEPGALRPHFSRLASQGRVAVLALSKGEGFVEAFTSCLAGKGDADSNGILTALELKKSLASVKGLKFELFCDKPENFVLPFAMPSPVPGKADPEKDAGGPGEKKE